MNKISKIVKRKNILEKEKPVVNFMGGISYNLNPIDTLKMITASSIFGEPQYYRNENIDRNFRCNNSSKEYNIFDIEDGLSPSEIMIDVIKSALDYDFEETIKWATILRKVFYMRLNPQLIMVLASKHPKRKEFDEKNPKLFRNINLEVMQRADEPASQLSLYLYLYETKNKLPSILKRSWKDRIENMSRYEMNKYKKSDLGLINVVRLCHANNKNIDELMQNGTLEVDEENLTWEILRSQGWPFKRIIKTINMPYMALLRNLRNIFSELKDEDKDFANEIFEKLKNGVLKSKQFPFRYYSALKSIYKADINFKSQLIDTLEDCLDISIDNMPKLKGKTICLSDNSGSAWGTFQSEYGSMTIADIDNLSSVITAKCSEEGYVGKFGDKLDIIPISKKNGALIQSEKISSGRYTDVGGSTENGIWIFFRNAIEKKVHYDNIFIYSDMQAGHGGLYGEGKSYLIGDEDFAMRTRYIDVLKLINKYRKEVNPKVNVFCVQTAGYTNTLIPEYTYRGAILYGWTGKETLFASEIINQWDNIENR